MVTSGGQQAIDLSIRTFVNPGDTVLAEGPTYPGAVPCFTTYEAQVEHVPMDDDGLRIDLVEEALDRLAAEGRPPKLLYTIPSFQNPGGVTMSLERRERLIALAHQRELLIVEDNPYGQIRFEGEALPTLWELDDGAGWVIYLSTFSKILAPGLRAGWVAAPAAVLRKMNLGKQAADLASSTVSQRFVVEYLRRHDWREYVGRLNGIYRLRRDAMLRALEEEMPPEARWTRPTGGLFVWATLPEYLDTTNLLASAVERHQVAFVPGRGAFLDGRGGHSMRLNFSGVPEAVISEGVRRLGVAVAEMTELHRALGGAEG
jgi:2-aminoadipate transaminase